MSDTTETDKSSSNNFMMISLDVRRVPLDFDAPIGETWKPLYDMPEELALKPCPVCGPAVTKLEREERAEARQMGINFPDEEESLGDGYSPTARQLDKTFYALFLPHNSAIRETIRWNNKITQEEADILVADGRFNRHEDCPNGCVRPEREEYKKTDCECWGRGWVSVQPGPGEVLAEDINASQDSGGFGHDAINRLILIEARCKALGVELVCSGCKGKCNGSSEEGRKAYDDWSPPEIPEGPGYQLWQTISEGGPESPVFETVDALCEWLTDNYQLGGSYRTFEEWKNICEENVAAYGIGSDELI